MSLDAGITAPGPTLKMTGTFLLDFKMVDSSDGSIN
jgi:hypothetical protein